jgi:hypothetical protein
MQPKLGMMAYITPDTPDFAGIPILRQEEKT